MSYVGSIKGYSSDLKLYLIYTLVANVSIGVFALVFNLYLLQIGLRENFIGAFNAIHTMAIAGTATNHMNRSADIGRPHSFSRTISGSRQVMSNHGSRGPYRRRSGHHDLPGSVGIQLDSLPSGAVGENHSTYEPSSSDCRSADRLDSAGYGADCSRERVCVS